jgi:hypothetical protein
MSIKFQIDRVEGGKAFGTLSWSEKGLSSGAISGPYARAELPAGLYHAFRSKLLDKPDEDPYCDSLRNCWFQVLDPQFSTDRTDLGIHPDGNQTGTLGCIGLFEANTSSWYEAFSSMPNGEFVVVEVFL